MNYEFFCSWYFFKPRSFTVSTLFFHEKSAKFEINCRILIYFKCMIFCINTVSFRRKSVKFMISRDWNHDFAWLVLKCAFFSHKYIVISSNIRKFAIFATICLNMNFFCHWYFLNLWSFCVNTLLFCQKLANYMIPCD